MAADEKWYFTKEQLANTPSRKCGYEGDKELSYRQQAANFIQDMGQRLQVTQLCINTAIVYMHRFYVFHSFTHFHRNAMAAAALFLAAKVEEQPRKLEHVIKVAHMCLNRDQPPLDIKSEKYLEHAQDLVFNENVLLQTLGFDVAIDHPHTHVVRCCHLVRASKDLAQTSYFMASNSLHLTTMCLQYKPTVVACFCIHLACKWSNWEIPQSNEGKDWFWYVDKTVTLDQLEQLTAEFLVIFDKCPTKLKRKIMSISATQNPSLPPPATGSLFDMEPRKIRPPDGSQQMDGPMFHTGALSSRPPPVPHHMQAEVVAKPPVEKLQPVPGPQPRIDYRDYKDKKERERMVQQPAAPRDGHHGPPHLNKSIPSSSSKHGQAPPNMINKPHHRDHKHPPPMRPSGSQPRVRDQSYTKRDHIFAPPIRHSEPQPPPEHHDTNHVGSVVNCNASTRKDNQPHEVTVEHISRDPKAMSMQMESSSKRGQQPVFDSSSRHNRVPPTSANNSDGRVKEEVSSKIVPDVGHMYNHKHGVDHNRHRRMAVNEQFPPKQPEGVSERKSNVTEMSDRKSSEFGDRKLIPTELVDRKPNVSELADRKPVVGDIPDRKSNVTVHPSFSENRHESSSRRPDNSKHVVQQYHQTQVKPEIKFDANTIKKEDTADFGGRVENSSSRPGPPLPPAIIPPPVPPSQPPPQQPPPPPPPPSQVLSAPVHHSQDRHKSSRSKSPQPQHSRSPAAPPRIKSPTPPNRRSDSPHGKIKNSAPLPPRNGATLEEKPVVKRPEAIVISKQEPPPTTIKPEVEASPVKVSSGERQKASLVTPDKSAATVPRESPYPRSKSTRQRTPPSCASKKTPSTPVSEVPTTPVSSFGSPPLPGSATKLRSTNRHRTSSSSSEPELVPVVKKLDEIRGYENIIRDSKIGIKLPNRVPDIIPPIRDRNNKKEEPPSQIPTTSSSRNSSGNNSVSSITKELKLPDLIGPIATMRSSSAKPPSLPDDLGAVAFPESDSTNGTFSQTGIPPPSILTEEGNMIDVSTVEENAVPSGSNLEHHHKSEKKKKKKEHKHKDKEKSREEKKHKHKHKEKDKDRHKTEKGEAAPIKITIPKDKIVSSILEPANNPGLKLKIIKDRLKDSDSTGSSPQTAPSGGLKIKISKDIISNFNSSSAVPADIPSSSRKRDRVSPPPGPPSKSARLNTSTSEQRRSGNSSNNYGKQNGVEHHRRGGGGSHYSGNKVVQKMVDSDNAGKSS